ncbi:hypothetical protein EI94DRAFT_1804574 [Lactarius quietus]|nr:hypothetical protein EI94DRAFT_1804574 [Lactarius quietus]
MLFFNTLFSFVAAIALANGATAAVTPRNTPTTTNSNCNAVGGACCNQVAPVTQLDGGSGGLLNILGILNGDNVNVGINCAVVIDSCNTNSFCCSSSQDVTSFGAFSTALPGLLALTATKFSLKSVVRAAQVIQKSGSGNESVLWNVFFGVSHGPSSIEI